MRKFGMASVVMSCCLGLLAVGCGGSDDGDQGTAPTISNLTHDATTLALNQQGLILGSFEFTDPDGDAYVMQVDIVMPDGLPGAVPDTLLSGVEGLVAGTVNWNLSLTPPQAGTYDLTLRVVDEQGNVSNELQSSFEAQ